jgi:GNAT superfamily N-acetyltransferase
MDDRNPELLIVAADHPSLDDSIAAFGAALRAETRYFGRRGQRAARPSPCLVDRLTNPGCRNRLAGVIGGEIVAVAAVDDHASDGPELLIAVAAEWRRRGLALALGREIVARATERGLERIVLRTSYRSSDVLEAGRELGLEAIDLGRGRLALVRQLVTQPA